MTLNIVQSLPEAKEQPTLMETADPKPCNCQEPENMVIPGNMTIAITNFRRNVHLQNFIFLVALVAAISTVLKWIGGR